MSTVAVSRVQRIVSKYYEGSVLRKSKKCQRSFELFNKREKREWREKLQQQLARYRTNNGSRVVYRAFDSKPRGKNQWKIKRNSSQEEALLDLLNCDDTVELQGGTDTAVKVAIAAAGVAATACALTARRAIKRAEHEVGTLASQFRAQFQQFVDSLKKVGKWLFKFLVAAVGAWFLHQYVAAPVICAIVQTMVRSNVPEAANVMGVQKQSFGEVSSLAALLCCLIVPSMSGFAAKVAGNFMRTVAVFPKLSDGLATFMDALIDYVEKFVNWIMKREGDQKWTFGRKKDVTTTWRQSVIDICRKVDTNAHVPMDLVHELRDKVKEGYGLMQFMAHRESKDEIARWIDKLNTRLAPHLGSLSAENNMRPMPYLAILGGGSGIGKTSVVQVFASMILALSGEVPAEQVLQNLWQKGLSEYWNGYVGQRAIIKDDCFQVRGVAGAQDSEAMEIIRGIGNWACPLNFADLAMKGRVYLDVALMVGTTNAMNIKADWEPFITCPEALVRRFQGSYWLELNPEYATPEGKYDFHKISYIYGKNLREFAQRRKDDSAWKPTEDDVLDIFPWDAWTVRYHGFDNSNPQNGPILPGGMKEAVKIAASTIKMRKLEHAKTVDNITSHVKYASEAFADLNFDSAETVEKQAGLSSLVEKLRSATSTLFTTESLDGDSHDQDEQVGPSSAEVKGKLALDTEGEPILLDLERAHEHWADAAIRTIKEWFFTVSQCVYGITEKFMPHVEKRDGTTIINAEAYVVDACVWTIGLVAIFQVVKLTVKILWSGVSALFKLFGVNLQSNNPPAKVKGMGKFYFPRVKLQGQVTSQAGMPSDDRVHELVYKNLYMVGVRKQGVYTQIGNMLCLGSQIFIMPAHFDGYIVKNLGGDPDARVEIRHCTSELKVSLTAADFKSCHVAEFEEGVDMMGIRLPPHINLRSHRIIVQHFLKDEDVSNLLRGTKSATRLDIGRERENGNVVAQTTLSSNVLEYTGKVTANDGSSLTGLLRYEMQTKSGDCGGVLMLSENRYYGGKCILGLHVAGKSDIFTRSGYATILTYESVRDVWLSLCGEDAPKKEVFDMVDEVYGEDFVQLESKLAEQGLIGGSISYIGPAKEPVPIATKTAIKRSIMHGDAPFGPCPVAPAVLHPVIKGDEMVYPMAKAVEAYKSELLVKDPISLEIAAGMAFEPLFDVTKGMCADVLTFEEAVDKVPEGMKLKRINAKTSPGYKYKKYVTPQWPGKTRWLGKDGVTNMDSPEIAELRADVMRIIDSAAEGRREVHVCLDFLKDELRPLEKVEGVKTRMISGTELDYTVAVRMYFGSFCAAMLANPVLCGMAPGINHYTQWGVLADKLLSKGGKVFDGDFSRFDASEQPWVHDAILSVIQRWYARSPNWSARDDDIRALLWQDLTHSIHITGPGCMASHLVQWHKSLPSGHPLTTVVNSMYSLLTLTACYIHLTGDTCDMWKHVFINTFGDDNVSGVDDEVCEMFNQVTVAKAMGDLFGLTYTAGAKDGELVPYTDIYHVTFLKRRFVHDDIGEEAVIGGAPYLGWVGPLAKESFLYTPYFYRNNKSPLVDVQQNCEILQGELSLHSKEDWDVYNTKLVSWADRHGIKLKFSSRAAARAYIKTRFDVWF